MRQRITIQQLTGTRGPTGGNVQTWETICTNWASIEPLKGAEYMSGKEVNSEISTRIKMRWRGDVVIHSGMRVVHKSRVFVIDGPPIDIYTRNRELHLMCREILD